MHSHFFPTAMIHKAVSWTERSTNAKLILHSIFVGLEDSAQKWKRASQQPF